MCQFTILDVRVRPGDSAFLIDDGKTAILYDTGFGFTGHQVAERIQAHLKGRKLDYIFLTHSHYDHALGTGNILKVWPEAKVVAGAHAKAVFQKPSAKALMRELDRKIAAFYGVEAYDDGIDFLRVDIPVEDGDIISAGDLSFVAIHLPGHTRCSFGYYCPEKKLLLGCETLGVFDENNEVEPCYLVGYQMALDSIRRVEELEIQQILAPHRGLLSQEQTKIYLSLARKSAVYVAENIRAMLADGKSNEEIILWVKKRYRHEQVREDYPSDAMELNTNIMIELLKKENS